MILKVRCRAGNHAGRGTEEGDRETEMNYECECKDVEVSGMYKKGRGKMGKGRNSVYRRSRKMKKRTENEIVRREEIKINECI